MPHDSSKTPKFTAKFERDDPLRGRQMQVGWLKIGNFQRKTLYNSTRSSGTTRRACQYESCNYETSYLKMIAIDK